MYDNVIVGAGSAGCVLAGRLTEDPGTRVLLLEAGPPDDADELQVPGVTPMLWQGPLAWHDATTPQPEAGGRSVFWPHGRTLGGSSSIDGMVYIRGNRVDYDGWRERYGCAGWGYADLLPYFRRAEDQQRRGSLYHRVGGPLRVEDPRYTHPLSRAWLAAATASGLERNDDFNGPVQDGVGHYQATQRGGRRWSTADAYLRPAMGRGNLTVETGALVTRVVIEDGRAVGVRYLRQGGEREVRAGREVVLSGGAVNSPQLLLLSGVGPACRTIPPASWSGARRPSRTPWRRRRPTTWPCGGGSGRGRWPPTGWRRAGSPAAATGCRPRTSSSAWPEGRPRCRRRASRPGGSPR